jgi:hypothetical protein
MDFRSLAASPEWAALWASPQVQGKQEELLRLLRSVSARDPFVLGRVQGFLDALDWLERLPAREQMIHQRRTELREA